MNFIAVNEQDKSYTLYYAVTFEWVDPKLEFYYLKDNEENNVIMPNKIWNPTIRVYPYTFTNMEIMLQKINARFKRKEKK